MARPIPRAPSTSGTGLNKILKDMIVKSKTMAGHCAPYVPGWDCHGLPIETQVEKELGGKGKVSPPEFRQMCREYATRYVEQHKRDFKRLGVFGRWNDPYLTMSHEYEATIAGAFLDFMEKGYVYRGRKPVYWCIYDNTALAEAEVEYEDHTSPSIWVAFKVVGGDIGDAGKSRRRRLRRHLDHHSLDDSSQPRARVSSGLRIRGRPNGKREVAARRGSRRALCKRIATSSKPMYSPRFKGREFEGMKFQHPFLPIQVPGVLADYVTLDQGSGIVHTAPGHGADDFISGQKYGLEIYAPLDDDGVYHRRLARIQRQRRFHRQSHHRETSGRPRRACSATRLQAQLSALLALPQSGNLPRHRAVVHQDGSGRARRAAKLLRQEALEEIHKVKWIPGWGEDRIYEMIAKRPDWCISRQRFWGVPLIVFFCDACGKQLDDFTALRNVLKWFEKEGADAWYKHSAEELLPAGTKCSCGAAKWRKENDILDVWFDSGSSHLCRPEGQRMARRRLSRRPGSVSRLVPQLAADRASASATKPPYRSVVTHGWTLDEQGRRCPSRSATSCSPRKFATSGARICCASGSASQEYQADVKMSDRVMTQLSEAYRKIRNTFRFALGNLYRFRSFAPRACPTTSSMKSIAGCSNAPPIW